MLGWGFLAPGARLGPAKAALVEPSGEDIPFFVADLVLQESGSEGICLGRLGCFGAFGESVRLKDGLVRAEGRYGRYGYVRRSRS